MWSQCELLLFVVLATIACTASASVLVSPESSAAIRVIPAPDLSPSSANILTYSESPVQASSYHNDRWESMTPTTFEPLPAHQHRVLPEHHRPNQEWGDFRLKVQNNPSLYVQPAASNEYADSDSYNSGSMFTEEYPHPVPRKNGRNALTREWEAYKANPWPHINRFEGLARAMHGRTSMTTNTNYGKHRQVYSMNNHANSDSNYFSYLTGNQPNYNSDNSEYASGRTTKLPVFMPDIDMALFDKLNPYFNQPSPQYAVKK